MKAPSSRYKIVGIERAPNGRYGRWTVVERASGAVVWTGKNYLDARSKHAEYALGISAETARRLTN